MSLLLTTSTFGRTVRTAPAGGPPVATNDDFGDRGQGATAVVNVLANDTWAGSPDRAGATVVITAQPTSAGSSATVRGDKDIDLVIGGAAALGGDSFTYQLTDVNGSDTASSDFNVVVPGQQAVAADTDNIPTGSRYRAAGWGIAGGVIALSGRTSEPMPVLDDPRVVYSGVRGDVEFEFQATGGGAYPGGTWAENANGDLIFTSDGSTGVKSGEYRLRGVLGGTPDTWSAWTPLRIEAIARPSGTLFDVEAQAGANDRDKIQNAIDAADAAGGGVVYSSLGWTKEYILLNPAGGPESAHALWIYPDVHFFDLWVKRGDPIFLGGDSCESSSWDGLHERFSQMFTPKYDQGPWGGGTTNIEFMHVKADGNCFLQPIGNYDGDSGSPGVPGLCSTGNQDYRFPGPLRNNERSADGLNLQQAHIVNLGFGADTSNFAVCDFFDNPGDAIHCQDGSSATVKYCRGAAISRGFHTILDPGSNSMVERCEVYANSVAVHPTTGDTTHYRPEIGAGVDWECESVGSMTMTLRKSYIEQDLDCGPKSANSGSILVEDVVTMGPPLVIWNDNNGNMLPVTMRRTNVSYYYRAGSGSADRMVDPNAFFDDCDFFAGVDLDHFPSGKVPLHAYFHSQHLATDDRELRWDHDDDTDNNDIHLKNCRFHALTPTTARNRAFVVGSANNNNPATNELIFEGAINFGVDMDATPFSLQGETIRILAGTTFNHDDGHSEPFWSGQGSVIDERSGGFTRAPIGEASVSELAEILRAAELAEALDEFLQELRPLFEGRTTRQRLASNLRAVAEPVRILATPRSEEDVVELIATIEARMPEVAGLDPLGEPARFVLRVIQQAWTASLRRPVA